MTKATEQAGRYGRFGGQFVPETLMTALTELEEATTRRKKILALSKT